MKFVTNVGVTFLTRVFTLLAGIAASVIVARVLGPEGQGIYSLAVLLPSIIVTFTSFGLARSTIYHIGKGDYQPGAIISTVLTLSLIISLGSILIGLMIVFLFSNSILPGVPQALLLLSLLLIPFQLLFTQSFNSVMLGFQEIHKYNIVAIIHSISLLALIAFFLIGLDAGITGAITANVLALLLATVVAFLFMPKFSNGRLPRLRLDKKVLGSLFSFGYKVYLGNVLSFLHLRADMLMLNYFLNPLAVGYYAIAVGITEKLWMLSQAVDVVIYPKVASMKDEGYRKRFTPLVLRHTLFITILGAVALFLLSRWLVLWLYSEAYLPSIVPLQILLIGIVAFSAERILWDDIDARGKPMINTYIVAATFIANVILNLVLIPKAGIAGAAWATSISYSLASVVKLFIYCRLSGNSPLNVIVFRKSDINLYLRAIKDWYNALK